MLLSQSELAVLLYHIHLWTLCRHCCVQRWDFPATLLTCWRGSKEECLLGWWQWSRGVPPDPGWTECSPAVRQYDWTSLALHQTPWSHGLSWYSAQIHGRSRYRSQNKQGVTQRVQTYKQTTSQNNGGVVPMTIKNSADYTLKHSTSNYTTCHSSSALIHVHVLFGKRTDQSASSVRYHALHCWITYMYKSLPYLRRANFNGWTTDKCPDMHEQCLPTCSYGRTNWLVESMCVVRSLVGTERQASSKLRKLLLISGSYEYEQEHQTLS